MANVFDQFDQPQQNVFDQFDAPQEPVQEPVQEPAQRGTIAPPINLRGAIQDRLREKQGKITQAQFERETAPMRGLDEAVFTVGTGAVGEVLGGIAGAVALPFVGSQDAEGVINKAKDTISYQPSEAGMESLETIGKGAKAVGKAINYPVSGLAGLADIAMGEGMERAGETIKSVQDVGLGETAAQQSLEAGGSPELATLYKIAPVLAMELMGLKALQKARKGTRLIDDAGQPTKELRKALDKQGLTFDDLTPQAKQAIPKTVKPDLIPGANAPKQASEKAIFEQIKSGGKSDALAGLKITDGSVVTDIAGKEALRQGFRPGVVQSIKTASPASKVKMKQMIAKMKAVKKNERLGLDMRPSDVVGGSMVKRISFIRDKANTARLKLENIARTKLGGKSINTEKVKNAFLAKMDELDIKLDTSSGIPKPIFQGSAISKDRTSQRVIKDLIDLMGEGGAPDALRAHKLKRQLDKLIDFRKSSKDGITKTGKSVLKDIRHELNQAIRAVDPDYADVNDTLSSSLNALDALDDATGTIDVFGKGADKALGTNIRSLLSNRQTRVKLENAVNTLDDTVASLGGKFDDNIKDLAHFSDVLDERFGTVAKTSFQGQIKQGVSQAMQQGPKETLYTKGAEIVGDVADKMRGVNDFNAFESLDALLK